MSLTSAERRTQCPAIVQAAISMCCYNGGINRERSEESFLRLVDPVLGVYARKESLDHIEVWVAGLNADEVLTLVDGEETEMEELLSRAPPDTKQLFLDIWEVV